jgi:hypothetical protein
MRQQWGASLDEGPNWNPNLSLNGGIRDSARQSRRPLPWGEFLMPQRQGSVCHTLPIVHAQNAK